MNKCLIYDPTARTFDEVDGIPTTTTRKGKPVCLVGSFDKTFTVIPFDSRRPPKTVGGSLVNARPKLVVPKNPEHMPFRVLTDGPGAMFLLVVSKQGAVLPSEAPGHVPGQLIGAGETSSTLEVLVSLETPLHAVFIRPTAQTGPCFVLKGDGSMEEV